MARAKPQDTIVVAATGTSKGDPAETVVKVMELVEDNLTNPTVEVLDAKHPDKPTKATRYKKVDQKAKPTHQPKPKAAKTPTKPKAKSASLVKEVDAEIQAQMASLRQEETRVVFDTANRWGNREDLTPLERCHGTAHEVYTMDHRLTKNGQKQQQARHEAYAQHFDNHFLIDIEQRRIRAAKDLFTS